MDTKAAPSLRKTPSERSSGADEIREALKRTSLSSIPLTSPPERDRYTDGCVILGSEGSKHKYATRYRINHSQSRSGVNKAILQEECVPCCSKEEREKPKTCIWSFIKSEAFLFSLHMTALGFGVAKEAMDVRDVSEDLELVHSLIETFVAILMISIRMTIGWMSYKDLKHKAFKCEYISANSENEARGRMIRHFRNTNMVIGAALIALSIICFLLFKFFAHLGWTILSNNFCMIVYTVVSGLYTSRVDTATATIKEDQQRTIFFEALLLLHENINAHKSGKAGDFNIGQTESFIEAVRETEFLEKPEHISIPSEVRTAPMFTMWRAMDLQTMA